jgi:hypothetical protein
MFPVLVVSNIANTSRWITEHVSFKSKQHAQRFLDGIALEDLPEGDVLRSTPIYPPDGQPLDPLLSGTDRPFTTQSEAEAVAVANAVREVPPRDLERHVNRSTPIFVVNPHTQCVKAVSEP